MVSLRRLRIYNCSMRARVRTYVLYRFNDADINSNQMATHCIITIYNVWILYYINTGSWCIQLYYLNEMLPRVVIPNTRPLFNCMDWIKGTKNVTPSYCVNNIEHVMHNMSAIQTIYSAFALTPFHRLDVILVCKEYTMTFIHQSYKGTNIRISAFRKTADQ